MPTATVTVEPADLELIVCHLARLREIIASRMSTRRKTITPDQVSLRLRSVDYRMSITRIEIEVYGHAFLHRLSGLDARARRIATDSESVLNLPCSCWVSLSAIGYSPARR
jgi:hypothetical protein